MSSFYLLENSMKYFAGIFVGIVAAAFAVMVVQDDEFIVMVMAGSLSSIVFDSFAYIMVDVLRRPEVNS